MCICKLRNTQFEWKFELCCENYIPDNRKKSITWNIRTFLWIPVYCNEYFLIYVSLFNILSFRYDHLAVSESMVFRNITNDKNKKNLFNFLLFTSVYLICQWCRWTHLRVRTEFTGKLAYETNIDIAFVSACMRAYIHI